MAVTDEDRKRRVDELIQAARKLKQAWLADRSLISPELTRAIAEVLWALEAYELAE